MKTPCMKAAVLTVAVSIALSGCATTPQHFEEQRAQLSNRAVCRSLESAKRNGDGPMQEATNAERERRQLTAHDCYLLTTGPGSTTAEDVALVVVLVPVVVLMGVAVVLSKGKGMDELFRSTPGERASGSRDRVPRSDGESTWRWDQYTNTKGETVWGCRGTRFGLLVDNKFCDGQPQEDTQWPGLEQR